MALAGVADANVRSQALPLFRRARSDNAWRKRHSSAINATLDAIDAALAPSGADAPLGRQTLGGAVHDCKISGVPVRDTGDLDGDGLAVVSVRLVGP